MKTLTSNKGNTYFIELVEICKPVLNNLEINMDGYSEMLKKYDNLKSNNFELAWELALETNSWSEYLSDMKSVLYAKLKDLETKKIATFAEASNNVDKDKVSKGDRAANKDNKVVLARLNRNHIEALYNAVDEKIAFLQRAHYFCKMTCELQQRNANNTIK